MRFESNRLTVDLGTGILLVFIEKMPQWNEETTAIFLSDLIRVSTCQEHSQPMPPTLLHPVTMLNLMENLNAFDNAYHLGQFNTLTDFLEHYATLDEDSFLQAIANIIQAAVFDDTDIQPNWSKILIFFVTASAAAKALARCQKDQYIEQLLIYIVNFCNTHFLTWLVMHDIFFHCGGAFVITTEMLSH